MNLTTNYKVLLSDLTSPVSMFLKIRQQYAEALLLESSDYHSKENSLSFICFDPIHTITVQNDLVGTIDHVANKTNYEAAGDIVHQISSFQEKFNIQHEDRIRPFIGLFGFTSFDAVQYFDTIKFDDQKPKYDIPDIIYSLYKYVVVFDHFYGKMTVIEILPEGQESNLDKILVLVNRQDHQSFEFRLDGEENANMKGEDFKNMVTQSKSFCQRGDVFQIVPSRRFSQRFRGDEFNVYRALRSINPSPYLFYFDYGGFKIFGSSPEAQMVIKGREAEIHPIAGTFKRTGDDKADSEAAIELSNDPKENAEHTMLVDLARNDLSKNTSNVHVEKYKEVQYFSHVIHLTSVVKGTLKKNVKPYQIFADTFPAGTLSGAPKYRALELIDDLEPTARGYYGGGIGMLSLDGDINHAIMIRSFLSYEGKLHYQAGAGIVIDSQEENELQEVNNKLAALKKALIIAEEI